MTTSNSTSQNRPKSHLAEIWAAHAHVTIAVLGTLAIFTFIHALHVEKNQNAEESIARLYPLDLDINQKLTNYPMARVCLREDPDGEHYRSLKDEDKAGVKSAVEAYGDLFEYYVLIRGRIQDHENGNEIVRSWDAYMEDICKNSCAFREQINSSQNTWTKMFLEEFHKYVPKSPTLGPESCLSAETPPRQSPRKR